MIAEIAAFRRRVRELTEELRQANSTLRREIIERKRAEDWIQSLIETTQDAVISIDRQARVVLFNPAAGRVFGYTETEVRGQKVTLLMAEPYAGEHDGYVERYERTREPRVVGRIRTVTARRKNGDLFPIELSVTEVKTDEAVHYVAFLRDISEKVRLQDRLVERERLAAIGTTAAKLGHEIGNPLHSMSLATGLLEQRLGKLTGDETVRLSVRVLRDQIARLENLLGEFRSLSRRQQFTFRPTNLCDLVHDVLTAELPCYAERGIAVELIFAPDLPMVQAAVEAMPEGGTLTVHVHNSGAQVRIEVTDTGTGVSPAVNIFEPFVTTKKEGTGLGLPIVRQIVDAHGGTLTCHSEPGKGTTFVVTLPLRPGEAAGSK
jgi:two-component system, LuxR family, sensor kinase FixL